MVRVRGKAMLFASRSKQHVHPTVDNDNGWYVKWLISKLTRSHNYRTEEIMYTYQPMYQRTMVFSQNTVR